MAKEWPAVAACHEKTANSFLGLLCRTAALDWTEMTYDDVLDRMSGTEGFLTKNGQMAIRTRMWGAMKQHLEGRKQLTSVHKTPRSEYGLPKRDAMELVSGLRVIDAKRNCVVEDCDEGMGWGCAEDGTPWEEVQMSDYVREIAEGLLYLQMRAEEVGWEWEGILDALKVDKEFRRDVSEGYERWKAGL